MTMAPPTNHTSILPQQLNSRVQPSRSVGKYTKGILVFSAAGKRFLTPMTNTRTVTRKYAAMKGNSSGLSALQGTTPRDLRISRQIASAARDAPEQNAVVRVAIGNATARSLDFPKLANSRRSPRRAGRPAANPRLNEAAPRQLRTVDVVAERCLLTAADLVHPPWLRTPDCRASRTGGAPWESFGTGWKPICGCAAMPRRPASPT